MLGAIIGDICGSTYEIYNCKNIRGIRLFRKGSSITDDTVMTIAVAKALLEFPVDKIIDTEQEIQLEKALIDSMRAYGNKYPYAGYGLLFKKWLKSDAPVPYNSFGNGSAMRVSSVGWLYDNLETTLKLSETTARVTHNHPEGIKGAKAIGGAVYLARTGASKREIREFAEGLGYDLSFTIKGIRDHYCFDASCQRSVPQAIESFLESHGFDHCIKLAISLGGDSDTIAAMAGSIAEAYYGIPEKTKNEALKLLPEDMVIQYERFLKSPNRAKPIPHNTQ